jgi:hypothetical protein
LPRIRESPLLCVNSQRGSSSSSSISSDWKNWELTFIYLLFLDYLHSYIGGTCSLCVFLLLNHHKYQHAIEIVSFNPISENPGRELSCRRSICSNMPALPNRRWKLSVSLIGAQESSIAQSLAGIVTNL